MASDEFVDATIANLKVIGMVPRGGRLCVRKGQLCIDAAGQLQPLRRWVRGDSRDMTLMHVRNTVQNACRILAAWRREPGGAVDESGAPSTPNVTPAETTTSPYACAYGAPGAGQWAVRRIAAELEQAAVGLGHLRETYAADSLMVANLHVLVERIAARRAPQAPDPVVQRGEA